MHDGEPTPHKEEAKQLKEALQRVLRGCVLELLQKYLDESRVATALILDAWLQFGYHRGAAITDGGLSTLEDIAAYLRERNIIDEKGQVVRKET
jgi:hypothetical protein